MTFFSGTDIDELVENSKNHNYYVSFIVNNRGDYTCKIGVHTTKSTAQKGTYNSIFGKFLDWEEQKTEEEVLILSTKIILPEDTETLPQEFIDNVEYIIKKEEKEQKEFYQTKNKYATWPPNKIQQEQEKFQKKGFYRLLQEELGEELEEEIDIDSFLLDLFYPFSKESGGFIADDFMDFLENVLDKKAQVKSSNLISLWNNSAYKQYCADNQVLPGKVPTNEWKAFCSKCADFMAEYGKVYHTIRPLIQYLDSYARKP